MSVLEYFRLIAAIIGRFVVRGGIMRTARAIREGDFEPLFALNEAAVPHVNSLSVDALRDLVAMAAAARVACDDQGRVLGAVLAFVPGAAYDSANYRWFSARFEDFVYIDRVMVAPEARGGGVATSLYRTIETVARDRRAPRIVCEVNLRPANEGSLRFHANRGFREVGRQETEGGSKLVSLLEKSLTQAV